MHDESWQAVARQRVRDAVEKSGSVRAAARELGVNHETLRRVLDGAPIPRGADRAKYVALGSGTVTHSAAFPPHTDTRSGHGTVAVPAVTARQFASAEEQRAYVLGILDMGASSNRIVTDASAEVSRAISAAMAALLAPITPIAVANPDTAETRRRRASALRAAAADDAPARSPRRKKA